MTSAEVASSVLTIRQIDGLHLELRGSGRLLPWLGPALRGIVAGRYKGQVCHHPPLERRRRWKYCDGCQYQTECGYAICFEPAAPAHGRFSGRRDASRTAVISPGFPVPEEARPGLLIPLRITTIGERAASRAEELLEVLREAGRRCGIGPDEVRFEVGGRPVDTSSRLDPATLPAVPDAVPGVVPRLGVGLMAPLFLTRQPEPRVEDQEAGRTLKRGTKRAVSIPEFDDLFRAALRAVGTLCASAGQPVDADFKALKGAAALVRRIDHCFEPFRQEKYSSRSGQRFTMRGCYGGGVYADVPMSLVPWLLWGGRIHTGTHRVAGAGAWRIVME